MVGDARLRIANYASLLLPRGKLELPWLEGSSTRSLRSLSQGHSPRHESGTRPKAEDHERGPKGRVEWWAMEDLSGFTTFRRDCVKYHRGVAEGGDGWWAMEDLNFRPRHYQCRALTS